MLHEIFSAADILLPDFTKTDAMKWSVIACDQFTGDPAYWETTAQTVGDAPSTLGMILPEIYLEEPDVRERIHAIHATMDRCLHEELFHTYRNAMIYTERVQSNGILRCGVIGKIDLEAYDYSAGSNSPVRATEATVLERIPPRMKVRAKAPLELPHIMILCDDPEDTAIGTCTAQKAQMQKLYDTSLMNGGGSIAGYLMDEAQQDAFRRKLHAVMERSGELQLAMGDGNHSLATAKACYESLKAQNPGKSFYHHPARYALVELVNLHSEALQFEAIHRIVTKTQPGQLMMTLAKVLGLSEEPSEQEITVVRDGDKRTLYIHKPTSKLSVGSLQNALDAYLMTNPGKIDYIHGAETVERLSEQEGAIGFLLPDMDKSLLFPSVAQDGALPRKTFSMGHAEDKRYYMEARKIR
ncbi:MAG: DUF1015 domain-containing protein [Oscillospiraceae bacterium]|nr:DUF1015 domain-containing protein [Oscillospiraceae bacterium]